MDTKEIKVKVDRGVFHSIVSEITPEIMDDSQQPEWSVKELDKLYDRLFVDNYDNLFDLELSQQGRVSVAQIKEVIRLSMPFTDIGCENGREKIAQAIVKLVEGENGKM